MSAPDDRLITMTGGGQAGSAPRSRYSGGASIGVSLCCLSRSCMRGVEGRLTGTRSPLRPGGPGRRTDSSR
jgi:hypothetical protein